MLRRPEFWQTPGWESAAGGGVQDGARCGKVDLWTLDTSTSLVWNAADIKHVARVLPVAPLAERGSTRGGEMKLKTFRNPTNAVSPPRGLDKGNILSVSEHLPPHRFSPERPGDLWLCSLQSTLCPSFLIRWARILASVAAVRLEQRQANCCFLFFFFAFKEKKMLG